VLTLLTGHRDVLPFPECKVLLRALARVSRGGWQGQARRRRQVGPANQARPTRAELWKTAAGSVVTSGWSR
jgi:hypothetical protein